MKSYIIRGVRSSGIKKCKTRITIGLCCSARGEKLKPLIIGKLKRPRCFSSIRYNTNKIGVHDFSNKNAWMTKIIFEGWLRKIDKYFRQQKRHVLLFVDNFSGHEIPENLTNIVLKFFPPNTTSRLQPLDQGVIRTFKSNYRRKLLNYLRLSLTEIQNSDIEELKESLSTKIHTISMKDAFEWLITS